MSMDGKQLVMDRSETAQEHELVLPLGKLRLTWELYRPDFGNTIAIQTGVQHHSELPFKACHMSEL